MSGVKTKHPLKILIVDDEPDLLMLLCETLASLEFEVLSAPSGNAAFEIIQKEADRLVLVVSDYAMADGNGFDLRRKMLAEHKQIPFVLVSGHITREAALDAVDCKINAFLEKPFQQKSIFEIISRESKDRVSSIRDDDELIEGFIAEATALIEEMESLILSLEDNPLDSDAINRIFACAHTIKGTSGFFKPDFVHRFTHRYEDFLSHYKKNPGTITAAVVSVLLRGLDTIKSLVADLEKRSKEQRNVDEMVSIFNLSDSKELDAAATVANAGVSNDTKQKAVSKPKSDDLRVSVELLNQFMEKSGELTVLRNMVNKIVRVIEVEYPRDQNVSVLGDLLGEMHKVNVYMQEQVVDLRKISLKQVFKPLVRTLRDLCVSLGKKIDLTIEGDELRVDHSLAETLNKCLIHLLRNAADHGIEDTESRLKQGKNPSGKILIMAQEVGEKVVIRMKDDGRGIDPHKVKAKSIEKGIITPQAAEKMSDSELQLLIFEPGFSTAEKVTDVSGRGVGTDMVRGTVLSIGGNIDIQSKVGEGTEFILNLPVPKSVLIIDSLLVKVCTGIFAIPQDAIRRVVNLTASQVSRSIQSVGNAKFLRHNGHLIPIACIQDILGLHAQSDETKEDVVLVEVQSKHGHYCIQVNEVYDIEDTVVKQIGPWLKAIPVYAGVTFLGDGRVGMILDVDGIAQHIHLTMLMSQSKEHEQTAHFDRQQDRASVLLFNVDTQCTYGVLQSQVFRLEEFSKEKIQFAGEQPVVVYRDKTMPLYDMRAMIQQGAKKAALPTDPAFLSQETLLVVVVHRETEFRGYVVKRIEDFVDIDAGEAPCDATDARESVCIIKNRTVTLLKLQNMPTKAA